jgi:hypothetical protein
LSTAPTNPSDFEAGKSPAPLASRAKAAPIRYMPSFSLNRTPCRFGVSSTVASTRTHFWSGFCCASWPIVSTESNELAITTSGLAPAAARRLVARELGSLDCTTFTSTPHSSPPALAPSAIRLRNWLVPSCCVDT